MIYKGLRIWKERDYSIEKGDIGYQLDKELPERITRTRFYLEDVREWEEHLQEDNFFKNNEKKVNVVFDYRTSNILLISIEEFDNIMEEFNKTKLVKFKDN